MRICASLNLNPSALWHSCGSALSSVTEKVKHVVEFPEYGTPPVPFYKNRYKVFALAPLSVVLGHLVDIPNTVYHFSPFPLSWAGDIASFIPMFTSWGLEMSQRRNLEGCCGESTRLMIAVGIHFFLTFGHLIVDGNLLFDEANPFWEFRIPWLVFLTAASAKLIAFTSRENPEVYILAHQEENLMQQLGAPGEEHEGGY